MDAPPDMVAWVEEIVGPIVATDALTGGASRQTWACRTEDGRRLIVQRVQPDVDRDVGVEAEVVAAAVGVPAPELIGVGRDSAGWHTMLTVHVPGETIARKILRDDEYSIARTRLVEQLGRAAARVHAIEPSRVPSLPASDAMADYRDRLDQIGHPHPAFELAFRWLDDHRPNVRVRQSVVHGDLRLGNVIVDADGLAAVIDWELVHFGDPVEDLGWLCVPAWRYGAPHAAAGLGSRERLLDAYESEAGWRPTDDELRWWEIAGIVRWGIICIMQAERHRSGGERSHELAAIGRRVCENEHELFLALEGRW